MRGYDILQRWKRLDGKDREKAVGFFLGGEGMQFEGFTDSEQRWGFAFARHSLDKFEESIGYAERGRVEIMVDMQPIELCWLHAEPVMSKAGVVSGSDFPRKTPEPIHVQNFPRIDWSHLLILSIFIFMMFQAMMVAFGADVKGFGAIGDGVTDDTAAIQAAADDCKAKIKAIQPTGGSYQGTSPELFFPSGKYRISAAILLSPYQTARGEDAILIQADQASPIFRFDWGYQNKICGLQFVGGSRQVTFANANIDSSFLTFRDCSFQGWQEFAVFAEGTVDDLHLSTTLSFDRCRWDGGRAVYTHCDTTQISNSEVHFRGSTIPNGGAWITNKGFPRPGGVYSRGGTVGLSNITFVPAAPIVPKEDGTAPKTVNAYWIENGGNVVCDRIRFGGEGAGVPIINHVAPISLSYPYSGSKVILSACQVSCGQDADGTAAILTVRGGFPQCLRITACDGLISNKIPIVRVADGYNLGSDVQKLAALKTAAAMYSITIQGNQIFASQPIPVPLQPFVK